MADCFITRRGGGGMNVKFISIASENELPASAGKNVVAVIYDGELCEWQISPSEPVTKADGTSLANGDLWIVGSISDEGIVPSIVYVYSDNTWNNARFAMYQDGAWVWFDSVFSLYNYNKPMGYMAGELLSVGVRLNPSNSAYAAWVKDPTIDSDGVLTIDYNRGNHPSNNCCVYYFRNKVDLTNFTTLYLIGSMTDNNDNWVGYPHMAVMSSVGEPPKEVAMVGGTRNNPTIDVSELSGEYYIGFIMMSQGSTSPGTILKMSELYLE